MTIMGIDDTDSATEGMCTTFIGAVISRSIANIGYEVNETLLVRLNPSVEFKTRGNAAVAIHTTMPAQKAFTLAKKIVFSYSRESDEKTNPSVVVSPEDEISTEVSQFTRETVTELKKINNAEKLISKYNFYSGWRGNGRGRIGSLAAIGALKAFDNWTYETLAYRENSNIKTKRNVDYDSVFEASDMFYPLTWDTIDTQTDYAVCVPQTPCPVLYGIRGNSPTATKETAMFINSEPVNFTHTYKTNQGTDAHIQQADNTSELTENQSFAVTGTVQETANIIEGGHVFVPISDGYETVDVGAFSQTNQFRDKLKQLRVGDIVTAVGEYSNETIKLEKLRINKLKTYRKENPVCQSCNKKMESAGNNSGYRCKNCSNTHPTKVKRFINRNIRHGWYESPPNARRHLSKPLVIMDTDYQKHPER